MHRPTPAAALVSLAALLAAGPSRAEGGLRKGPWLMDLRPGSVVVMAERTRPGSLRVSARALGPAEGDAAPEPPEVVPVQAEDASETALHEVQLRGLLPGTRYRYEVTGPGVEATGGTFSTPPEREAPFRFVIYGDTRSDRSAHRAVVDAVHREGADFAVHTGDLVADGRDEGDWQDFFDIEAPLLRDVPLVPVIGNHEYVHPLSSGMPNYQRYVHFEPTGPTPEVDATFRFANARFVLTSSYDDWTGPSRDWLALELDRARREAPEGWLFVVMHEGPRSSGPHGDSEALRDAGVDRLLRRARVDLVISGHDHAYERGDDEGLRYMVSGGGGAPLYPKRTSRSHSRVYRSEHHHVRVDVERERVKFTALRPDGTVLDEAVLRHDGWEDMRRPAAAATSREPAAPAEAAAPTVPPLDLGSLLKYAPLFVLVSGLAWWARRRAERG